MSVLMKITQKWHHCGRTNNQAYSTLIATCSCRQVGLLSVFVCNKQMQRNACAPSSRPDYVEESFHLCEKHLAAFHYLSLFKTHTHTFANAIVLWECVLQSKLFHSRRPLPISRFDSVI